MLQNLRLCLCLCYIRVWMEVGTNDTGKGDDEPEVVENATEPELPKRVPMFVSVTWWMGVGIVDTGKDDDAPKLVESAAELDLP